MTDSFGLTYRNGHVPHHDTYQEVVPHPVQNYHGHDEVFNELAYLIGPLARAVRILTFQTVTPLFELAIYSATYYYRTITSLLANFLGRFLYEVACLLGVDQLIYGYSGGFGGGALGYDPFPVSYTGGGVLGGVNQVFGDVEHATDVVGHAVSPVIEAAIPVGNALQKGLKNELVRVGKPYSLSKKDFVHELIVWFRRAIWFMIYTGAVRLSPQLLVLTIALGAAFEAVMQFGEIDKTYLNSGGHHGGGGGYSGKADDPEYLYDDDDHYDDDIGNHNYVDDGEFLTGEYSNVVVLDETQEDRLLRMAIRSKNQKTTRQKTRPKTVAEAMAAESVNPREQTGKYSKYLDPEKSLADGYGFAANAIQRAMKKWGFSN